MTAHVYIMTNKRNGTLYVGVTSDLKKRVYEHREGLLPGFTEKYRLKRLVWFESHDEIAQAIAREKQLKRWRRAWKIALIEASNADWRDLWSEISV